MAVSDHFMMSTWMTAPLPVEKGALAMDNYDPTYGDGGIRLGPDVYECTTCGALVLTPDKHAEWHDG